MNKINMTSCLNKIMVLTLSTLCLFPLFTLQGCTTAASGAASGVSLANDRRDSDTIIDDKYIEVKAVHAIINDQNLWKQSHISVHAFNNALLLVGQTPTEKLKQDADQDIKNIPNVRVIHNELTVGPNAPIATRSRDTWTTTQIKAKLVANKLVSASHIKVVTESNVVYLMGITTREEALAATDIARAITGVTKVVQLFEYVQ